MIYDRFQALLVTGLVRISFDKTTVQSEELKGIKSDVSRVAGGVCVCVCGAGRLN